MNELLFTLPFLSIFLAIFMLLLAIPVLSKQYFNYSIIDKLLLKSSSNEEFPGLWKQWFPEIKIPTELLVTIIGCIVIFILLISLVFLILLIRNYHNENNNNLNFKVIIASIILSILLIFVINLLFLSYYTLYIVATLLLISLIIIKIPLNKNLINNDKSKQVSLGLNSEVSFLNSPSVTSSITNDNNELSFSNSTLQIDNKNIESDEWINNFKATNLLKENTTNNNESTLPTPTEVNDQSLKPLSLKPVTIPSGASLNFFKGKVDLKFLENVTYETLETFIFIDFSHFKKYQKIQENNKPIKIIEEQMKPDNSFMKQLNDLINKKNE